MPAKPKHLWQKRGSDRASRQRLPVDPLDFSPALLRIQGQPPAPLARSMFYLLLALLLLLLLWSVFGRLDIVATAEGKLLPQSYLKIVQPAEQGIIRDILVTEGEAVKAGQVLMRLDATLSDADGKALSADQQSKKLALRRIAAELAGQPHSDKLRTGFTRQPDEPEDLYQQTLAQYRANRTAFEAALSQEQSAADKARSDLAAAQEIRTKLLQTLPHYRAQDEAYANLARDGYASKLAATDKARERIEKEQDLKSQEHIIQSAQATITGATRRIAQISADYRQKLQAERADTADRLDKTDAELAKQQYRNRQLELKAPQDGVVKDLATHTPGTVISPGAILMTLVPKDEILRAEVWVNNADVGFIHTGEPVKLKLAAYQFQKYGMIDGLVTHLSADASDTQQPGQSNQQPSAGNKPNNPPTTYRALIDLKAQQLIVDGVRHTLTPGMQVTAEIKLGTRTIIEYLLSPVTGAFQEAGRER